jgi:hypothetical protein
MIVETFFLMEEKRAIYTLIFQDLCRDQGRCPEYGDIWRKVISLGWAPLVLPATTGSRSIPGCGVKCRNSVKTDIAPRRVADVDADAVRCHSIRTDAGERAPRGRVIARKHWAAIMGR